MTFSEPQCMHPQVLAWRKKKAQKANPTTPKFPSLSDDVIGNFTFVAPKSIDEQVTITPLLTPDPDVYQAAMLALINSVQESLYIQLQYIHPTKVPTESKFTDLIDAVAAKINAGKDVRIILSQFQKPKGGLEALQAAGVNLKNVRIQNKVHNKGFVFDHKKVVVSSMNWSGEGVLANRGCWSGHRNATAAQYYERIFLGRLEQSRQTNQSMLTRIRVCLLLALTSGPSLFGADFAMKVTDKNYLDTQGFSVFLYDSTYHPVFVDQKNTAMEMILHGQRIATNGDVRLMPTPEQWDLVATLKGRHADKANNRLTADLAFPTFDFSYTLEVAAEPGGVKVSINLDKPLPQKLAGRAGFNLEFLPSIYMGKAYLVDGTKAGIFPRTPNDPMVKVLPPA